MSYTGTKAQSGLGTTLAINTGTTTTPVWTVVGEIHSGPTQENDQLETDDATNLQSTTREFIATILNTGGFSFSMNRVSADAGQVAMLSAHTTTPAPLKQFQITMPKTTTQVTLGDVFAFSGYVDKWPVSVNSEKKVTVSGSIKVSGSIVLTVGS